MCTYCVAHKMLSNHLRLISPLDLGCRQFARNKTHNISVETPPMHATSKATFGKRLMGLLIRLVLGTIACQLFAGVESLHSKQTQFVFDFCFVYDVLTLLIIIVISLSLFLSFSLFLSLSPSLPLSLSLSLSPSLPLSLSPYLSLALSCISQFTSKWLYCLHENNILHFVRGCSNMISLCFW